MLVTFLKRAFIGAVAIALTFVAVKVVKKVFGAKEKAEEAASEEARATANSDIAPRALPKPVKKDEPRPAEPIDIELETLKAQIAKELRAKLSLLGSVALRFMGDIDAQAEATARHFLALQREEERKSMISELIPLMDERIEVEYEQSGSFFPRGFGPEDLRFRGIYKDEMLFKQNSIILRPLMEQAVRQETPGTKEFMFKYRKLYPDTLPGGWLVPKGEIRMTDFDEISLMNRFLKYRQYGIDEPMDLDKYRPEVLTVDIDDKVRDPLGVQTRILLKSESVFKDLRSSPLPRSWRQRVYKLSHEIKDHIEGYTDDAMDRALTHLACLYAARNCVWGLPGSDMAYFDIASPLFKYCVFRLRHALLTEECFGGEDVKVDNGLVVDAFEELLTLIAIPNPMKGDVLGHTPMIRVGKT